MRKNHTLFACLLMTAFLLASCNKYEKTLTEERSEMIINKDWILTIYLIDTDGDGMAETNTLDFVEECTKDDLLVFKGDGSYEEQEGLSKCDPEDPSVISTGTWALINEGESLKLVVGNSVVANAVVADMTDTRLQIEMQEGGRQVSKTYKSR